MADLAVDWQHVQALHVLLTHAHAWTFHLLLLLLILLLLCPVAQHAPGAQYEHGHAREHVPAHSGHHATTLQRTYDGRMLPTGRLKLIDACNKKLRCAVLPRGRARTHPHL